MVHWDRVGGDLQSVRLLPFAVWRVVTDLNWEDEAWPRTLR